MRHFGYSIALAVLALACGPQTASARDRSFTAVLRGLEHDYQFKQKKVPGMWLARCVLKVAHPRGVSKLDLALFENNCSRLNGAEDFEKRVQRMLGTGWRLFVQVDAPKRHERTLMFARPDGRHMKVMLLCLEPDESVALFARIHPSSIQRLIDNPREVADGRI